MFGNSSGFNKFPVLKLRPLGVSGNTALVFGFASMGIAWYFCQISGAFLPRIPGASILSPQGRIPMDLTPDELLEKQKE